MRIRFDLWSSARPQTPRGVAFSDSSPTKSVYFLAGSGRTMAGVSSEAKR